MNTNIITIAYIGDPSSNEHKENIIKSGLSLGYIGWDGKGDIKTLTINNLKNQYKKFNFKPNINDKFLIFIDKNKSIEITYEDLREEDGNRTN